MWTIEWKTAVADRLSKLTIDIARLMEKPKYGQYNTGRCFMCLSEGHGFKGSPETKAFVAAGVIRYDASNRLVMSDGSPLPHSMDGSPLVHLICERANMHSAATLEWMCNYVRAHTLTSPDPDPHPDPLPPAALPACAHATPSCDFRVSLEVFLIWWPLWEDEKLASFSSSYPQAVDHRGGSWGPGSRPLTDYELANKEFATLGEGEFEVYPAYACPVEHGDSDKPKASKSKLYDRPPLPMRHTMLPEELNTAPAPNQTYVKIPPPPKILKWPLTPQEDEPMTDGEFTPREKGKQRAIPSTSCPPAPHSVPKSNTTCNKVTFEEPKTPDSTKTPAYKQRALPAYKFTSELQERLNSEEVLRNYSSPNVQRILIAKKAETATLDLEPLMPLPVEEEEPYFRPVFDISSLESKYSDNSDSRASVNTDEQAEDFYCQLLEAEHL
ncbi:uncharacterized protein EI90DRAFT_3128297 [Cantharellus anzutake]|uniref:uncharacterized protein n=1 Tax=Cantharellus anzutake TaxID=1750568 RepID=UPI00190887A5|nr:uncharacterized protein EI90DRAFT_3128297 [Cantharellus anzutake]KAF8325752.1 hypothetical protein EI90DRAFT_3128297 [Cantharellus anzutake]